MDVFMFQFDGPSGEALQQCVGTFCKYQSMALESLKDRRKKESKLQVTHPFDYSYQSLTFVQGLRNLELAELKSIVDCC